MTFSIDNPEGGLQQPPLRKICLGKTLRRTRVKIAATDECYQHPPIVNSGVTGGGQGGRVPPETSDREIFADVSGKKRQGKKGKGVKIEKKRWKIGN